jgi:hypothetical protein
MKIEITKRHPANGNKFFTVCNYGYFLKRGKWELISIKFLKWDLMIFRQARFKTEWPVNCG